MALTTNTNNGVRTITLDRPKQRNAMNSEMLQQLQELIADSNNNDAVNVVRIVANGTSFCAGSDLKELGSITLDEMCIIEAKKAKLLRDIALCNKPVIAAVQGYAVGGGAFLAAVCDIIVAAEDAKFKCMEVPNGWITPWGMHSLNARLTPRNAQRLAWGYEFTDAEKALDLGFVDYVVGNQNLEEFSAKIASDIAQMPSLSVQATKEFFQTKTLENAEIEDAHLNKLFKEHCLSDVAQETFKKFSG